MPGSLPGLILREFIHGEAGFRAGALGHGGGVGRHQGTRPCPGADETQIFHRDGVLLQMAKTNRIAVGFLEQQETVWRLPDCNTAEGSNNPACILPPLNADLQPTALADRVSAVETWLSTVTGLKISLPMLKTVPAWAWLQSGLMNSLILISGALLATLAVALVFGALLGSRAKVVQWPMRMLLIALQSTPPVMALVIAATIANAVGHYSATSFDHCGDCGAWPD